MKITHVGENAIVLSVSYGKTHECVRAIRSLYAFLSDRKYPGIVSLRPGLDSLVIEFGEGFDSTNLAAETKTLLASESARGVHPQGEILQVPVRYEKEFAPDLSRVAEATGLTPEQVIELHTSTLYEVWMIGFMPGFPYMGGLPMALHLERKKIPDPQIRAGSVAIAEEFVGIYPFDSPGGWHVIGRTPWSIIDYSKPKPALFEYGMRVKFYRI